ALLRRRPLPLRLQSALAKRLPAREPRRRELGVAAAADAPGDLGLPRPDDAGDDAVDARRRARPRPGTSGRRPDRSLNREKCYALSAGLVCPIAAAREREGSIPLADEATDDFVDRLRGAGLGCTHPRPARERRARHPP